MIYGVLIKQHIYRNFETFELGCNAYKKIEVPFVPYVGLIINIGLNSFTVKKVVWDNDDGIFRCNTKSEGNFFKDTFDEEIIFLQKEGWEIGSIKEPNTYISIDEEKTHD